MGDRVVLNPFTRKLDFDGEDSLFKGVLSSAPLNPKDGWTYINSGDNKLYFYYGGNWNVLNQLQPPITNTGTPMGAWLFWFTYAN